MVPYLLLPFFALDLLLLATLTRADHFVCSWRPGDEAPDHYGFKWFTTAEISKETDAYARWLTMDDRIEVATWGDYKPNTIEISERWCEDCLCAPVLTMTTRCCPARQPLQQRWVGMASYRTVQGQQMGSVLGRDKQWGH